MSGVGGGPALSAPQQTRRNIWLLRLDMGWQGLITAGITTFIAVFLVRLGASPLLLSLLTSLPALITIVFSVLLVPIVERHPNRVRLVTVTRLATRACYTLIALAPFALRDEWRAWLPAACVALWSLSALFGAVTNTAFVAVLGEVVPPRQRPAVNGVRWALHSLVTAVSVAIFGRLLDILPFPDNFQLVFIFSCVAGLISALIYDQIRLPRPGATRLPATATNPWRYFATLGRASLGHPAFLAFVGTTFVYRLGLSLPAALYPVYWVREVGASNTWIGLITTAVYGTLVASYVAWGRAARRYGSRRILLITSAGLSLYPLLTPLVREPLWLIPVAIIQGAFIAGIDITFFEGLLESSPPEQRASFAAVHASTTNIAILIGPLLGAALAGWLGIRAGFVVGGVCCLVGTLLFYALAVGESRSPLRAATE